MPRINADAGHISYESGPDLFRLRIGSGDDRLDRYFESRAEAELVRFEYLKSAEMKDGEPPWTNPLHDSPQSFLWGTHYLGPRMEEGRREPFEKFFDRFNQFQEWKIMEAEAEAANRQILCRDAWTSRPPRQWQTGRDRQLPDWQPWRERRCTKAFKSDELQQWAEEEFGHRFSIESIRRTRYIHNVRFIWEPPSIPRVEDSVAASAEFVMPPLTDDGKPNTTDLLPYPDPH